MKCERVLFRKWLALGLLLVGVCPGCSRADPIVDREQWFGVYMLKKKIGYAVLEVGEPVVEGEKLAFMRAMTYARLGADESADLLYDISQWATPGDFVLRRMEAMYRSGGHTTRTTVKVKGSELTYVITTAEGQTPRTLAVPEGQAVKADLSFLITGADKEPRKFTFFNILTLKLDQGEFHGEQDWKGMRMIRGSGTVGKYIIELNEQGKVKTAYGAFGIRLDPADELEARDLGTGDYVQWLEISIPSTFRGGAEISTPSRVTYLRAKVVGIDPQKMPEIEGRQKVLERGADWTRVEVVGQDVRSVKAAPDLPITAPEVSFALESMPYLPVEAPEIQAKAREVLGGESNSAAAAAKLCAFVDQHMRFGEAGQVPRRADELLKSGVGVCRDYAALYAALARASGLPTRLCSGVVFSQGAFYLHAWADSYVGRWIAVDPTRSGQPADATHITFGVTDVAGLWDLTLYGPDVRIEVEEFRVAE